jgi:hypothetical protein
MDNAITDFIKTEIRQDRYHSDWVRFFLLIGSLIMLVALPFYLDRFSISIVAAIFMIVIIVLFSGMTDARQPWVGVINWIISFSEFCVFEYEAVTTYQNFSFDGYFLLCQLLALIFLVAFYFATETLRGFMTKEKQAVL